MISDFSTPINILSFYILICSCLDKLNKGNYLPLKKIREMICGTRSINQSILK